MKSCLIVDDSRVVRKVTRRIVEELGFTCTEAEDGKTALDLCLAGMPDSVVLNWNMPVMNGLEFLNKLRKSPGGTRPKVIFCTTENDLPHITQAMQAGADEYIMKPFDREIIITKFVYAGLIDPANLTQKIHL